jgi:multicomponent Na+:H+ antiporter subunit A
VLGEAYPVKLALWHGLNLPLALSAAGLLLGGLLYLGWNRWRTLAAAISPALAWGPARLYEASLVGLARLAAGLTHSLQSGHLHRYMAVVIAATSGLVGLTLLRVFTASGASERFQAQPWPELRFYETLLAGLILAAAFVVVRSNSRLVATAALGVVGFGVSLIFVLFGAPDLAMTQILVESVTVILLVLILYHLPGFSRLTSRAGRARDAVLALAAGGLMTALVLIAGGTAHFPPISSYYLENSVELAHGRNIVNVILVDFRGLDTLGEITVLSLAAIGVFALLRARRKPGKGTD